MSEIERRKGIEEARLWVDELAKTDPKKARKLEIGVGCRLSSSRLALLQ